MKSRYRLATLGPACFRGRPARKILRKIGFRTILENVSAMRRPKYLGPTLLTMQLEDFPASGHGPEENGVSESGPAVGRVIDERFVIEGDLTDHSLGGGFSVLAVADLKNYSRKAVLKISRTLPEYSAADGPSLKEVGDALIRIGHAKIEEILETGRFTDGRPFVLAEPYPPATLGRLIEPGQRLDPVTVAELAEQFAEALAAVHSRGILHCDLRPANILVPDGSIRSKDIKIINFGSGWPIDARGESLMNARPGCETLHYAAPELLVKLGHRSPVSDVYSFAVLVYRLLTGAVPYPGRDRVELLEMINAGTAKMPTQTCIGLSREASDLIMSGLEFEPILRPQNVHDFGLRLVRLLSPPKGIPIPADADRHDAFLRNPVTAEKVPAVIPRARRSAEQRENEPELFLPADAASPISFRAVAWTLIFLLVAGALSIPVGQAFFTDKTAEAAHEPVVRRTSLNKLRNRITYEVGPSNQTASRPDVAGGNGNSKNNKLAIVSDAAGDLNVFSEFTGEDGRPNYRLIYPITGAKAIEAAKPITIAIPERTAGQDAAVVWIVWTPSGTGTLESVPAVAANDGAVSGDESRRRLRHFLERNRNLRIEVSTDQTNGRTVLNGFGDKIVHRLELASGGRADSAAAPPS